MAPSSISISLKYLTNIQQTDVSCCIKINFKIS